MAKTKAKQGFLYMFPDGIEEYWDSDRAAAEAYELHTALFDCDTRLVKIYLEVLVASLGGQYVPEVS